MRPLLDDLPDLKLLVSIDGPDGDAVGFHEAIATATPIEAVADTTPDDPAMMIYTSGTTGPPKGALHGHRVLLGHLPGMQLPHEFFPRDGDLLWTPADWAWAGGLLNGLLPALHFGVPVVARKLEKFDPEEAFRLMADMKVRNIFVPPTALRMLRAVANPRLAGPCGHSASAKIACRCASASATAHGACTAGAASTAMAPTRSGNSSAHSSACMPPIEPPMTSETRRIPSASTR